MPKSRRDRQVTLSKVKKKTGMEYKNSQISIIRKQIPNYKNFFTFSTDNTRNSVLKQLRLDWNDDSRFFQTKRRLIQIAFGRDEASEVLPNLSKFAQRVKQDIGLIMTNKSIDDIKSLIDTYNEYDFSRAGNLAVATVVVKQGPINDFVTHSEEPHLRIKLELPVKLDRGIVHLLQEHRICNFKDTLNSKQALQLKTFKVKLSEFRINLDAMYSTESKEITVFEQDNQEKRLLEHLTYNKIVIEDGDYAYTWDEEEVVKSEKKHGSKKSSGLKKSKQSSMNDEDSDSDSETDVQKAEKAMMMPSDMML